MKKYTLLSAIVITLLAVVGCSKWTEPERLTFENQDVQKLVKLIEAQSEADLNPHMREYYKKLREEYRTKPRVKGFGWFGNWTAKGDNAQNYLRCLPDSVDFVSLWGTRGKLSEEQKIDLKFFQEVKGGKALLCWIVQDLGGPLTPVGKDRLEYWVQEKGGGNFNEGVKAYANAIVDTIEKYNLDGFDIDYEPGYGHSGDLSAVVDYINGIHGDQPMQVFIETLSARLRPKGRMLVMDGEPYWLSAETSKLVDHYIYQAYWERSTAAVTRKISNAATHLDDWERKTIITVEFEQTWRNGGVSGYTSANHPEFNGKPGTQIFDYATLDLPSGKRIGGVGTYHMEYDYANTPEYKWLRKALYYGNQKYPGNFQ
ncbi:endoglycosidase [Capnocytophaga sp. HP1101]